jgi:hypothetical protein
MGPYNKNKGKQGADRLFGQTMRKSSRSSSASRYQRQMGNSNQRQHPQEDSSKADTSQSDEKAAWRRLRQEQAEIIDAKFGYHRLEDQYQERQKNSRLRTEEGNVGGVDKLMQRRGWLFNMAATTVRLSPKTEIGSIKNMTDDGRSYQILNLCFLLVCLFFLRNHVQ